MKKTDDSAGKYEYTDTILLMDKRNGNRIQNLCKQLKVKVWATECLTDIIAVPAFLCIMDPKLLTSDEWKTLAGWVVELDDANIKFLLTNDSKRPKLPARNVIKSPDKIDNEFLKFIILKTRSKIMKKNAIQAKPLRQIIRLMDILHCFDAGEKLSTSDLATHLEVSTRTVQRDIAVLEMAGFVMMKNERDEYYFPKDYRMYDAICRA